MQDDANTLLQAPKRAPWNKGKLTGAKPPLRQKHVWAIRTKLQIEQRARDLAMFNLAIDSKLRGCDLVALRVEDVAPNGYSVDRVTVRQKKTGRPVRFELTEQTRQALDAYLKTANKKPGEFLFTGPRGVGSMHDHPAIRAAFIRVDRQHRVGPSPVRYPFAETNKGDTDLPPDRQSASCAAIARSYQDREHRQVSWYRG